MLCMWAYVHCNVRVVWGTTRDIVVLHLHTKAFGVLAFKVEGTTDFCFGCSEAFFFLHGVSALALATLALALALALVPLALAAPAEPLALVLVDILDGEADTPELFAACPLLVAVAVLEPILLVLPGDGLVVVLDLVGALATTGFDAFFGTAALEVGCLALGTGFCGVLAGATAAKRAMINIPSECFHDATCMYIPLTVATTTKTTRRANTDFMFPCAGKLGKHCTAKLLGLFRGLKAAKEGNL